MNKKEEQISDIIFSIVAWLFFPFSFWIMIFFWFISKNSFQEDFQIFYFWKKNGSVKQQVKKGENNDI